MGALATRRAVEGLLVMFHRHRYEITAVRHTKLTWNKGTFNETRRNVTQILNICKRCGHVNVVEVSGHWTLEDVRGSRRRLAAVAKGDLPWTGYT